MHMRLSLLKLFMTAMKFKGISTGTPFTLRVVQGIKVLLYVPKSFGAGEQVSLQLALNQRWSGPQMTGPLSTVAYSRLPAGWPRSHTA
jgi:hypothetical protein